MKNLLKNWIKAVLLVSGLAGFGHAADLKVSVGDLDLILPFQNTEAVSLYDVIGKRGYVGAETVVAAYRTIEASFGVVTNADMDGTPFIGVRRQVPAGLFKDRIYVGVWIGRDFRNSIYRGGIKASVPLWGGN